MTSYAAVLNVAVRENVPVGYNVTTISASDPDGSSDGIVFYEFEGNSSVSFCLSMNSQCFTYACNIESLYYWTLHWDINNYKHTR